MRYSNVLYQINDLPRTYKRSGSVYVSWSQSLTAGLVNYTDADRSVIEMSNFANATGPWLKFWGMLFGNIPKLQNQTDAQYKVYITNTLLTNKNTPLAIQNYVDMVYNVQSVVEEFFPKVGWALALNTPINAQELADLSISLNFVRPAGVPVMPSMILTGGLFLGTINYVNRERVTGSYLGNPTRTLTFTMNGSTDNSLSQLPTLYLTDPTLNPILNVA